jgi:hypothetical protein
MLFGHIFPQMHFVSFFATSLQPMLTCSSVASHPCRKAASLCSTVLEGPNKIHGPCSFRNTYIARQDDEVGRLQDSQSSLVFTCHCWLRICVRYSSIASVQAYLPPPACTRVLGGEPDRYACLALGISIPLLQKITLYHHPT